MQARVPQGSVLFPTLYNLYINDTPQLLGIHLALFADDICLYETDCKESCVLRKLQRRSMATWCERWNININENKTQMIYLSYQYRQSDSLLTLNGQNILFVNGIKYLSLIIDKKITWELHIETTEARAFTTFIRLYPLFKSERLSKNIKSTLHKTLIRSAMTYACPA
jgi:hypothetical protein